MRDLLTEIKYKLWNNDKHPKQHENLDQGGLRSYFASFLSWGDHAIAHVPDILLVRDVGGVLGVQEWLFHVIL